MKLNTIPMTAQIPSGFGMPICGHASVTDGTLGATSVVRERQLVVTGDVKGDMGLAVALRPGTSAWSPPPLS